MAPERPVRAAGAQYAPRKKSGFLRKKDLAQFRELLLAKRAELIGDVSTLQSQALSKNRRDASGDLSSMPIHMADLGTDNYEKEFTLGLIEGERALLREIDEALARIGAGTYGICEATGKPIGKARLKARPWAKFCYEYVLAQEKGQQDSGL
ncbi:MAG: TraR/DksA family transcriptional regulator [Phycisphaerae bacterium]